MLDLDKAIAELNERRSKMSLIELIEDIESRHFRTAHDTGANLNALMIWNMIRGAAGLPKLTIDDLWQRHAADQNWTAADIQREKGFWKEYLAWQELMDLKRDYHAKKAQIDAAPKTHQEFFNSRKEK